MKRRCFLATSQRNSHCKSIKKISGLFNRLLFFDANCIHLNMFLDGRHSYESEIERERRIGTDREKDRNRKREGWMQS
jgi:hypothetical protein